MIDRRPARGGLSRAICGKIKMYTYVLQPKQKRMDVAGDCRRCIHVCCHGRDGQTDFQGLRTPGIRIPGSQSQPEFGSAFGPIAVRKHRFPPAGGFHVAQQRLKPVDRDVARVIHRAGFAAYAFGGVRQPPGPPSCSTSVFLALPASSAKPRLILPGTGTGRVMHSSAKSL
jgi:hypothetical protein